MRFFAVAGASIISMGLAGSVVRGGGLRLAEQAQKVAMGSGKYAESTRGAIKSFRRIEEHLDALQGIDRQLLDPNNETILVGRSAKTGKLERDSTTIIDSFNIRTSANPEDPWLLRDELQQRLVTQARRLPYELPGFYLAQKAVIDPVLGTNENKKKVNWANPIDVVGDFAYESLKNLALNVVPFDAGMAGGKTAYRGFANKMLDAPSPGAGYLTMRTVLEQVGADAADLTNKALRLSHQTTGAFSNLVTESTNSGQNFTQWVRSRSSAAILSDMPTGYGNSGYARKLWEQGKYVAKNADERKKLIDTLPGPFRGMGSGLTSFKKNFKQIGETYDDWQNVVSGRVTLDSLKPSRGPGGIGVYNPKQVDRYTNLLSFMTKGGGTYIEEFAERIQDLGKGGPRLSNGSVNPDWTTGRHYQFLTNEVYKAKLADNLVTSTGISREHALDFVRMSDKVSPFPGTAKPRDGRDNLMSRFLFGKKRIHGSSQKSHQENLADWWNEISTRASKYGIKDDRFNLNNFKTAVNRTDAIWKNPVYKMSRDADIEESWDYLHGQVFPEFGSQALRSMRKPYEFFENSYMGSQRDFLVRRSAQRLGVDIVDAAGNPLALDRIKSGVWSRGFNPDNLHRLRGFLIDQKDIASPWSIGAKNMFGFKPMSVNEAINNGYYGAHSKDVQGNIHSIVNARAYGPVARRTGSRINPLGESRWDLRLDKTYVSSTGAVLDFGRIGRGLTRSADVIADDYQIPLVHFKPLQIMGWSHGKSLRNAAPILYESGMSKQLIAMAGGKEFQNPDFYLWMKSSARRSKGKVIGINSKEQVHKTYEGLFKPWLTNSKAMAGRHGALFTGNTGVPSSQMQDKLRNRKLDVSFDQEDNLFFGKNSVLARWNRSRKRHPDAMRSPHRFAEAAAKPGYAVEGMTTAESEGMSRLLDMLKNLGFSKNTLDHISKDPQFNKIFAHLDQFGNSPLNISDQLLPRFIEKALGADIKTTSEIQTVKRLQQNLTNLLHQGGTQKDFWDLTVQNATARSAGISRRIDQLRSEYYGYLVQRQHMLSVEAAKNANGAVPSFAETASGLLSKLDKLHLEGAISTAEKAEGRAAVLGLQMDNAKVHLYSESMDDFIIEQNQKILSSVLSSQQGQGQKLLKEVGMFQTGNVGRFSGAQRYFRDAFDVQPYEKPYEVNPFGGEHLFVPTLGSVWNKSPAKAIKGLGFSWKDPKAVSSMSMVPTHMVSRIDRYIGTFNMGLDATRYNGAFDFYARGIVGKRVLPAYAIGTTAVAVDRTLGGAVNKDENGNPVYSPLVLGLGADAVAAGQVATAGLIPGGQTASEKKEELLHGEVPIRQGRYWFLGNTPFKGGRIQNFRPSWYQRLKGGAGFTPEMQQTPMEKLLFSEDFSPFKLLDPYRRERQDYSTRPYPLTGEYFTGPWGPLNGVLNATVGRVLKPTVRMHKDEVNYSLQQYMPAGESGAYFSTTPITGSPERYSRQLVNNTLSGINSSYINAYQQGGAPSSQVLYGAMGLGTPPRGYASRQVRANATSIAMSYSSSAGTGSSYSPVPYGVPTAPGRIQQRVVQASPALDYGTTNIQARRFGYQAHELMGIYGFGASALRESLGMGGRDFAPDAAVLEPASRGYSTSRSFWNLNIGGIGDLPLPIEGRFANFELSEIVRRFVPKEPSGMNYINGIPNQMGRDYPWLPGVNYPLANVKSGDPYNAISEGEMRLPGTGYARTHQMYPDQYGQLGIANIHDILGDIAPWSEEYKSIDKFVETAGLSDVSYGKVKQTRAQVDAMRVKNEFTPYEYKYTDPMTAGQHPMKFGVGRFGEWLSHRDTYLNTKFLPTRTALEDWERENVYGSTFPKWEDPVSSFLAPAVNKATQRNIVTASLAGGTLGMLFGTSAPSRAIGSIIGGAIGAGASAYGTAYEKTTGERLIPTQRKKELQLEEYTDILSYTRSVVNASRAIQSGDTQAADFFVSQSKRTMYGADLNGTLLGLAMAVPKRKREHFRAMLYAPEEEKGQILSTAGRLERRLLQAAWGMPVEGLPNLEDYYQNHELPPPNAELWSPSLNMDTIKIKTGQSMGLDMAQMGFYPQQVKEANLINPTYPDIFANNSRESVRSQIQRLLYQKGIKGNVSMTPTPFGDSRLQLSSGVY
jgi:hypothetical protein